jgi:predicted translin family RNA/ssDNA-binding protein
VKEPEQKKSRLSPPPSRISNAGFDKMISEMSAFDEARERVIKQCRDVQKLSKQSIYSLHRHNMKMASDQLSTACKKAISIRDELLKKMPKLRFGSFANAMEEYAEAKLYEHWLVHGDILLADSEVFAGLVNSEEYLGGLVDFTGEIGRFAVHQATSRNVETVKAVLATDLAVQAAVMHLASTPGRLQKKLGALTTNVKKLESLLYDLALTHMTGRKTAERSSLEDAPTEKSSTDDA